MGTVVQLTAADRHRLDAYRADAMPDAKGGIVVLQEAFGVNDHIRSVCDDYARRRYSAVAPALYDRQCRNAALSYDEAGLQQARTLRRGLDYDKVLLDVQAAIDAMRPLRVVAVGYCVGGSAAWLAACRLKIDAAACYYPSDIGTQFDEKPRCPVVMHFAERDRFIPLAIVERFRTAHPDVAAFVYPADHGFNCSDRAHGYEPVSAKLALERTLALFERDLVQ